MPTKTRVTPPYAVPSSIVAATATWLYKIVLSAQCGVTTAAAARPSRALTTIVVLPSNAQLQLQVSLIVSVGF